MSEAMSVEERNELNTLALQDIYGSIDNVEEAIKGIDNGSYFHEINNSILSVGEMIFDLNKTLTRIDDSLRVIAQNR